MRALYLWTTALCLALGAPACAAPTDGGASDESALHETPLTTAEVAATADPELLRAIQNFESLGGKGGWFRSTSPFGGTPGDYYLVRTLPETANRSAAVFLLRLEHHRAFLKKVIDEGAPIVFGAIPIQTQVEAAALGGLPLATDALRAAAVENKKNIILLQPTASKYVLAHEYRHFQDFEDAAFERSLQEKLVHFFEASYLSNFDKQMLYRLAWEIRGHATQRLEALADAEKQLPTLTRAGDVIEGPKEKLDAAYGFEQSFAVGTFIQGYSDFIYPLVAKIETNEGAEGKKAFLDAMSAFDFSDNPKNTLTFRSLFHD